MTDSDEVKLLPCEELSLSAAFDMGFEWAMSLRGQTMEDSRAVGRTLFSDTFALIADRLDTSDFNSFESADHGIVAAKAIIHAVLTRPPVVTDEVVELRQKLRMIISHASGGALSKRGDIDRSVNDICVEISRHKNAIWEQAQKSAAWDRPSRARQTAIPGRKRRWMRPLSPTQPGIKP